MSEVLIAEQIQNVVMRAVAIASLIVLTHKNIAKISTPYLYRSRLAASPVPLLEGAASTTVKETH